LIPGWRGLSDRLTIGLDGSPLLIGAGAIMGLRTGLSLFGGALIFYTIIGPSLIGRGIVPPGYQGLVAWNIWPASAMMVAYSLLSFGLHWRVASRALGGLTGLAREDKDAGDGTVREEIPRSWFFMGTATTGLACILLGRFLFDIAWWMGLVGVLVAFALALVAARANAETDVTPTGTLGKITQLIYGVIAPTNLTTNLMTASITAGSATNAADLLADLKTGQLVGADPRKQTIAQFFGIAAGTLLSVPAYLVIARSGAIGSPELPAPAAQVWASVAEVLTKGAGSLPDGAAQAMVAAGTLGFLIALAERLLPASIRGWIPSATGLSIAGVIPASSSITMFLGALAGWCLSKRSKTPGEAVISSIASGLIAGESLMGVAIIFWSQGPGMINEINMMFFGSYKC
jgi:OPT family oligopeptide transporter